MMQKKGCAKIIYKNKEGSLSVSIRSIWRRQSYMVNFDRSDRFAWCKKIL